MDSSMEVFTRRIEDIIPYEYNPRDNDEAAEVVAESIKAFGFQNPIILDENGVIVCGHARLKAAILLGLEEVPCIAITDLTPAQVRAFRIADNKTAEIAGWDYEALCREFQELSEMDFDLNLTGFNEFEQTEYGQPDAVPERPDRKEFKEYQEEADSEVLQSFNIVINCQSEQEKAELARIIHEGGNLKRLYRAEELIAMKQTA